MSKNILNRSYAISCASLGSKSFDCFSISRWTYLLNVSLCQRQIKLYDNCLSISRWTYLLHLSLCRRQMKWHDVREPLQEIYKASKIKKNKGSACHLDVLHYGLAKMAGGCWKPPVMIKTILRHGGDNSFRVVYVCICVISLTNYSAQRK